MRSACNLVLFIRWILFSIWFSIFWFHLHMFILMVFLFFFFFTYFHVLYVIDEYNILAGTISSNVGSHNLVPIP